MVEVLVRIIVAVAIFDVADAENANIHRDGGCLIDHNRRELSWFVDVAGLMQCQQSTQREKTTHTTGVSGEDPTDLNQQK